MKKNLLVLSDTDASGEWIATVRLLQVIKKIDKTFTFSLIAFSTEENFYGRDLFSHCRLIFPFGTNPPFSFLKRMYRHLYDIREALLYISDRLDQIDFFLVTHYLMVFPLLTIQKSRGKPIIYEFQGIRSLIFMKWYEINYREILVKLLERIALLLSTVVITPTMAGGKYIRSMMGILGEKKSIKIVPNGISSNLVQKINEKDMTYFHKKFRISKSTQIILYSGSLGKRKSLENLIYGYSKFNDFCQDSRLIIAYLSGNADVFLLRQLKQLVMKLNLSNKVYFMEDLSISQMITLYSCSDLTVLPSVYEVQPLSVLESLACGTPCIGTDIDGIREILLQVDKNLFFKTNGSDDIYDKLKYFVELSEKEKKTLKNRCIKIIKKYDIASSAKCFLGVLSKTY